MNIAKTERRRVTGKTIREESSSSSGADIQSCVPPKKRKALTPREQNLQALYSCIGISAEACKSIHGKDFKWEFINCKSETASYDETSRRVTGDPKIWRQALRAFVDFDPAAVARLFSLFDAELQQSLMDGITGLHVVKKLRDAGVLQASVQDPAAGAKAIHPMVAAYDRLAATWDLSTFPKYVRRCPDQPLLAKTLTAHLMAVVTAEEQSLLADLAIDKARLAEALKRVTVAVDNGLPVKQVIACLTAEGLRPQAVRALSLLLQYCAVRDFHGGKVFDLRSCMHCIDEEMSAKEWMHELGRLLASESASDMHGLQYWLDVMKSLVAETEDGDGNDWNESKLTALLDGFASACNPGSVDDHVNSRHLQAARVMCRLLRAQLTHEAAKLVGRLEAAVNAESAFVDSVQSVDLEMRKLRIRGGEQVRQACIPIVDGLVNGELPLRHVICELERVAKASEAIPAFMHACMTRARSTGEPLKIYMVLGTALSLSAQPEQLALHIAPQLQEREAEALIQLLIEPADGRLDRFMPILSLLEELCRRVIASETLSSLNSKVKAMVQEGVARLVGDAIRCCVDATNRLFEDLKLDPAVALTSQQLEALQDGHLEGVIQALASALSKGHTGGVFVVDALRSFINTPPLTYVVSLLIRALLEHWTTLDEFIVALLNADVPEKEKKEHIRLAREVALGFKHWLPAEILGLDARIGSWIDLVVVRPDGSAPGFDVLQVMLDDLSSFAKWRGDAALSLAKRGTEVVRRSSAAKAEPLRKQYVVPALDLIAKKRVAWFGEGACEMSTHKERFLGDKEIATAVGDLVLAVRHEIVRLRHVIEWLCSSKEMTFDHEMLLLMFINPLFEKWALAQAYELSAFMNLLLDAATVPPDSLGYVGFVFGKRAKSWEDRVRMLGVITDLSHHEEGGKLSRLAQFAHAYHKATDTGDVMSEKLSRLLSAMHSQLKPIAVPSATGASPVLLPAGGQLGRAIVNQSPNIQLSDSRLKSGPNYIRDPLTVPSAPPNPLGPLRAEGSINLLPFPSPFGPPQNDRSGVPPTDVQRVPDGRDLDSESESVSDAVSDADPDPMAMYLDGPLAQSGTDIQPISLLPPGVKNKVAPRGINLSADRLIGMLNGGDVESVRRTIENSDPKILDLVVRRVPQVVRKELFLDENGFENLATLISDRSVNVHELRLGEVGRGVRKLAAALPSSTVQILDLSGFYAYDFGAKREYMIKALFMSLAEAIKKEKNFSLKRLYVSQEKLNQETDDEKMKDKRPNIAALAALQKQADNGFEVVIV